MAVWVVVGGWGEVGSEWTETCCEGLRGVGSMHA